MNYVFVFRLEARNELNDAYTWDETPQPGLGDDFLEQIEETLARICQTIV
jgi:hypothetical protein